MAQIQEINQVGRREDLSDTLIVADAKNTPVTSMMPKGKKPAKTLFQWPHAAIPDPDTTPIPDGKPVDQVEDLSGGRQLLSGRVQKLRRVIGVSEFAEDISTVAGVKSEYANAKANGLLTVKRAIEALFCSDQDSAQTGTTYQTRGLGAWIQNGAQSDLPVPAAFRTPTGSINSGALTSLTEDMVRSLIKSIYDVTGQMQDLDGVFGSTLKAYISAMTIYQANVSGSTFVRTFFAQLKDNKLSSTVDLIEGDFGKVRCMPTLWNNWSNTTKQPDPKRGYLLNTSETEMRANKLPAHYPLPFDDSGPKGVITAIVALQVNSPLQHGKLALS